MRAHLVQLDIAWEDKSANYARVRSLLAPLRIEPGDLIVLPEMFDTGFSLNVDVTHDGDGATQLFLAALAKDHGASVYGGFTVQRDDGMGLNRAQIYAPTGDCVASYDKIHPFSFGREPERFVGGGRVVTCPWSAGERTLTVCPAICYDLRFPELFRRGLRLGAEVFVIGANWPAPRAQHWRTLLFARAIENQAYVIGVNRAGSDPHLDYSGGSIVVSPKGDVIADAGERECVITAEIDPEALRSWRDTFPAWTDWKPFLAGPE